uniref:Uncharacterized protein n=1 Tax=Wuchereria bancrofti TaxID=6293 RepID=A0AAF5RTD7_WUCBA
MKNRHAMNDKGTDNIERLNHMTLR